ncbi:hypothetical protein [Paractinoplanes aksuensis]|uniref:hypothetical protein n=1 Tax=Paractinoplanes aksuensis TaxID=2939490 RepID=UPI00209BBE3F|nr:hypothetical protein [Actinoplanes aksuensis]
MPRIKRQSRGSRGLVVGAEGVDHSGAVGPRADRSFVVGLAHGRHRRAPAQDESGFRLGGQRQAEVSMLMSFRYFGESQDVVSHRTGG